MTIERTFKVSGMMCSGCVANVEKGLKVSKGVKSAIADLDGGTVTVVYDEASTSPGAIQAVVCGLGYDLQL